MEQHSVTHMPFYAVLEDLYLNDTRQLIPKFEADSVNVTRCLNQGDTSGAVRFITDVDENSSTFGCVFNYFYESFVKDGTECYPALLILVRMI